jgi:hypothetical protein
MFDAESTQLTRSGHRPRGRCTVLGSPNWGVGRVDNSEPLLRTIQVCTWDSSVALWQAESAVNRLWRGRFNMRRREFITLLGGAAAGWPLAARAQQPGKRPIVGFLGDSTPLAESERAAAFARRLHDLGWIEGRTMALCVHVAAVGSGA